MEVTIDSGGRIQLPKRPRDALGLMPGSKADSLRMAEEFRTPCGRTARLQRDGQGCLVAVSETVVTDDDMFALIDSGRR